MKQTTRRSDIWFLTVMILTLILILIAIPFGDNPIMKHIVEYGNLYMIGLLMPYIIVKMVYIFFPQFKLNTKIFKWFNE